MSKRAEEAALKICPPMIVKDEDGSLDDLTYMARTWVQKGYEQAEKDLALTWEDAYKIVSLVEEVKNDFCDNPNMFSILKPITVNDFKKVFNEEVLRRFNEWRDKK